MCFTLVIIDTPQDLSRLDFAPKKQVVEKIPTDSTTSAQEGDLDLYHSPQQRVPSPPVNQEISAGFTCKAEDCNKAFIRKGDLARHSKSHQTGPKTYDCFVEQCRRKGYKGFWRLDKLKDHLDCKHPEVEVEQWSTALWVRPKLRGYRDVTRLEEHEAMMRSKGFEPRWPGSNEFAA
ncbi:MAG: hypothetical protein L6R41_007609 [Letrouitia leprolyta]|nr:MAG: hypothetical protein L6R41_007609 [Letrouitia leprolyta]